MIEYMNFTNVLGNSIDLNDDAMPMTDFTTEVDVRFTEKIKSQEHGIYPGMTYLGKRLFHCGGDIMQNTSAEYWEKRRQFIQACTPRPHIGYTQTGTLLIRFSGYNEDLTSDCTIDGWPEIPLAALSPSAGKYQVNFKAYDPRMYGDWWTVDLPFGSTQNIGGRGYNKIYNKTYAAGTSAGNDAIVTNSGDIETYPIITFYGPCSGPQVVLFRGDGKTLYLHLEGLSLLNSTDTVVVDVGRKTATTGGGVNVYSYAVGSDWWALEPGLENVVRYTADSGTNLSHATVQWRNAYMI